VAMSREALSEAEQRCLRPLEMAVVEATRAFLSAFAPRPAFVHIRFGRDAIDMIGADRMRTIFKIRRVCGLTLWWPEQPSNSPRIVEVAVFDDAARWQAAVELPAANFAPDPSGSSSPVGLERRRA
jgi:hypothetical protein